MRHIAHFIAFLFKLLFTLLVIGGVTGALLGYGFYQYFTNDLMGSQEAIIDLASTEVSLSSKLYYLDKATGEYREWVTLENAENRIWVHEDQIPDLFKKAVVSIEDERFWTHPGVDWKRTAHAAVNIFTGEKVFGGSTLTQQLIKNITQDKEVTIHRKILEIARALTMEKRYNKSLILEWYMNIVYFGNGQYGVGTAAEYYFGKDISDLSLAEMCCIAAITNNPSLYNPYSFPKNNAERRALILDKMVELGYISEFAARSAKNEELELVKTHDRGTAMAEVYPYYVDAVIEDVIEYFQETKGITREHASALLYHGGYNIYTCIDMDIQKKMDAIYQDVSKIPETRDGKRLQSSMVVIDPYTGDIVGLEGGVGQKTVARGLNWATSPLGRRPPGSSIKPISDYGPALEKGLITPDTYFLDAPGLSLKGTKWFPKNDGNRYYGNVTVRTALRRSLNTVAAQIMDQLTPAASYQFLTETLHMSLETADCDYAPLAAGQLTIGTTTREMASSYTIFPAMGQYTQGRTFSQIYDHDMNLVAENTPVTNQAISEKTAYWITDMLQEAVQYGTGTDAQISNMPAAGKTGTTTSAKDRWFVGYTPYYVGAVWTGYAEPARISVSGNPAAKIWSMVMESIHDGLEYREFTVPEDTSLTNTPEYTEPEDQTQDPYWQWTNPWYPGYGQWVEDPGYGQDPGIELPVEPWPEEVPPDQWAEEPQDPGVDEPAQDQWTEDPQDQWIEGDWIGGQDDWNSGGWLGDDWVEEPDTQWQEPDTQWEDPGWIGEEMPDESEPPPEWQSDAPSDELFFGDDIAPPWLV